MLSLQSCGRSSSGGLPPIHVPQVSISPPNGTRHLPLSTPVIIDFDTPLMAQATSSFSDAIRLTDSLGRAVPHVTRFDYAQSMLTLVPEAALPSGQTFEISINTQLLLTDTGEPLGNQRITSKFSTLDERFLGASFFNHGFDELNALTEAQLLGVLRFGGRWVTELGLAANESGAPIYLDALQQFCDYARARNQDTVIQIPILMENTQITRFLEALQSQPAQCNLMAFAIGNEPDRFDTDEEQYATQFLFSDYQAAAERIIPLVKQVFPHTALIAPDLSSFEEYNHYATLSEWIAPLCGTQNPAFNELDYLSIHLYPFSGAQKSWEMLDLGDIYANDLAQLPDDCPNLILGEFNVTYQWRPNGTYPGSGGDAYYPVLSLPEILHQENTRGMLHWSLLEGKTSTIGLFRNTDLSPKPLYFGYQLLKPVENSHPIDSHALGDGLVSRAFLSAQADRVEVYVANKQPIFLRDLTLGNAGHEDIVLPALTGELPPLTLDYLPPMSLTHLSFALPDGTLRAEYISERDQSIQTGVYRPTAETTHCTLLADFSEPNKNGPEFTGEGFNQNLKIASGGTPFRLVDLQPGDSLALREDPTAGYLEVDCGASDSADLSARTLCGVGLPVVSDLTAAMHHWRDWSPAWATGFLRLTLDSPDATPPRLRVTFADNPLVTRNTPRFLPSATLPLTAEQPQQLQLEWQSTVPNPVNLQQYQKTLQRLESIHLTLDQPQHPQRFRLYRVEICDRAL